MTTTGTLEARPQKETTSCRVIDFNIVAKIMEKTAAACREIAQCGDRKALQNFDMFEYQRGLLHLASMLTRGMPVGLAESDDETVRDFTEITLAMGGTVDSESDPPWVMFNPPPGSPHGVA